MSKSAPTRTAWKRWMLAIVVIAAGASLAYGVYRILTKFGY